MGDNGAGDGGLGGADDTPHYGAVDNSTPPPPAPASTPPPVSEPPPDHTPPPDAGDHGDTHAGVGVGLDLDGSGLPSTGGGLLGLDGFGDGVAIDVDVDGDGGVPLGDNSGGLGSSLLPLSDASVTVDEPDQNSAVGQGGLGAQVPLIDIDAQTDGEHLLAVDADGDATDATTSLSPFGDTGDGLLGLNVADAYDVGVGADGGTENHDLTIAALPDDQIVAADFQGDSLSAPDVGDSVPMTFLTDILDVGLV